VQQALREQPDYFDGPRGHRVSEGDALYLTWILQNARFLANQRYGVSEVMFELGGDEPLAEIGPIGFVERWKCNQVMLYYWTQNLDFMLATNPSMVEADLAPVRGWTGRRMGFFWYLGGHADGALLYDAYADLLFAVKGIVQGLPYMLDPEPDGTAPLKGKRVVLHGLNARPELNGQSGAAIAYDASAGRYAVTLERSAESVRVKPANLREAGDGHPFPMLTYMSLLPFDGVITYDGMVCAPAHQGEGLVGSFARAWREGLGGASSIAERAAALRARTPITSLLAEHAQRMESRWYGGRAVQFGPGMPPALRRHQLSMPGDLQFVPPSQVGPANATPQVALDEFRWWDADGDATLD
jgi:hypothetical protein